MVTWLQLQDCDPYVAPWPVLSSGAGVRCAGHTVDGGTQEAGGKATAWDVLSWLQTLRGPPSTLGVRNKSHSDTLSSPTLLAMSWAKYNEPPLLPCQSSRRLREGPTFASSGKDQSPC